VTPELQHHGHDVVAVDLPCDDDSAGLAEYADAATRAAGNPTELIVVAQSLAGFTGPLLCERLPVVLLVLVNAMVPRPGGTAGQWWSNTGHVFPEPFDPGEVFLHDVGPEIAAEAAHHVRRQSDTVFEQPWPMAAWPKVATRYLLCRDDRLFPAEVQRKMVRERLGITPEEALVPEPLEPAGPFVNRSQPAGVKAVEALLACLAVPHQSDLPEHSQVFGRPWLSHPQLQRQLGHRRITRP
jgi:pimeloyl-ACP methyl ester carboxylesterase